MINDKLNFDISIKTEIIENITSASPRNAP
jgi:hypothetical protein